MKFVPNSVALKAGRQLLKGKKHSPTILFVAGVGGMVTTTVLACRATLKLDDVLAEAEGKLNDSHQLKEINSQKYSEEDARKDAVYIYVRTAVKIARLYAPAVIVGVASITALSTSQQILIRRNAALVAAYTTLETSYSNYRGRVLAKYGAEVEEDIYHDAQNVEIEENGKKKVVKRVGPNSASPYARFFDEMSTSWERTPESNFLFLRCQQNYANDKLQSRGHLFLNEVYDMLGLERSQMGSVVGWVIGKEGDNFVDFGIFNGDNPRARDFVNGREGSILLDFNVDGVIYDKIGR